MKRVELSDSRKTRRVCACVAAAMLSVAVGISSPAEATTSVAAGASRIAITVSALDAAGRPIPDLTASELKARIESGGATVTSVSHLGAPKQIVVLLDTSSTWARGPQKMIWNTQCVSTLAEHLAGDSNFVVLGFSDHIVELYNGPAKPPMIERALTNVSRSGESALMEILKYMGESIVQQRLGDRTVLVVVSDGVDTVSKSNTKDVIRTLGLAGIPLYSLIVMDPTWNAQNMSKLNAKSKLLDISKATGGVSQAMGPGEVRDATSRIAAMLAGRYLIEIDPGVAFKSKSESKLEIDASREGIAMFYADHLYQR